MNADDRISVTLTAGQWNIIIGMLAEQPYRAAASLIAAIHTQVEAGANNYPQQLRSVE